MIGAVTKLSVSAIPDEESDSRPHPETVMTSSRRVSPTSEVGGRQIGLTNSKIIKGLHIF